MLIVRLLGNKHLLQLQVQSFDAPSQTGGQSVQGQQGHRLGEGGGGDLVTASNHQLTSPR